MTMEPCENSPYRWLSNLAERYALSIALVDRSSGQTLSYSALRSLLISELENLCSILAPFRTVWIVEERPDHIIVPYVVGLVMNKRVCVVSRQAFAAALDAFRRSTDNLALIYGDIQATEDPDFWRGQLLRSTRSVWSLRPSEDLRASEVVDRSVTPKRLNRAELLFFSSGTTGRSKGIVIPWSSLLRNVLDVASAFEFRAGERHLLILPLTHTNGQVVGLLAPLASGGSVVMGGTAGLSGLLGLWQDIEMHKIGVVDCVPTIIQSLLALRQPLPLSGYRPRLFITGGAPIAPELVVRFESVCETPLLQEYGLSEAVCISSCERPRVRKLGSVGKPLNGTEIKIVREDGSAVPALEGGRIAIKSASMMAGYETAEGIVSPISETGYLTTNDLGWFDNDGFLFIIGRTDDTLIKGGQNVVPTDVEAFACKYDGVVQCAIVRIPCDVYGEDFVLFYVTAPEMSIDEQGLKLYLRDKGDRMWYPRAVIGVDTIPTTESGKILRRQLQQQFRSHQVSNTSNDR